MQILPARTLVLATTLSPSEAESRLQMRVRARDDWKDYAEQAQHDFTGTVENLRFALVPKIRYRNSFLPHISGVIEPDGNGARVNVSMRLHKMVRLFLSLWLFLVAIIGTVIFVAGVAAFFADMAMVREKALLFIIVPPLLLFFGSTIPRLAFIHEADQAGRLLRDIFSAKN